MLSLDKVTHWYDANYFQSLMTTKTECLSCIINTVSPWLAQWNSKSIAWHTLLLKLYNLGKLLNLFGFSLIVSKMKGLKFSMLFNSLRKNHQIKYYREALVCETQKRSYCHWSWYPLPVLHSSSLFHIYRIALKFLELQGAKFKTIGSLTVSFNN